MCRKTTTNPPKGSDEKPKVTNTTHTATYNSLEESLGKSWKDARPKALKRIPSLSFAIHSKFKRKNNKELEICYLTYSKYYSLTQIPKREWSLS